MYKYTLLIALAMALGSSAWADEARSSNAAPVTLESAVTIVVAKLSPSQKSIVRGTAKDNLFMLMPEWGEDVQEQLLLKASNKIQLAKLCGQACLPEEATLTVMRAVWETLQK